MQFTLLPKWVPREHSFIKLADLGSKLFKSSDEYGISDSDYQFLQTYFNIYFSIDGFATLQNHRTQKFISYIPQRGAYDLNFFYHNMKDSEFYF